MRNLLKDKDLIKRIIVVISYFLITMVLSIPIAYVWDALLNKASGEFKSVTYQLLMYSILIALFIHSSLKE